MALFGGVIVLRFGGEEAHVASIWVVLLVSGLVGCSELSGLEKIKEAVVIGFVGFFGGRGMAPVLDNLLASARDGGFGRSLTRLVGGGIGER